MATKVVTGKVTRPDGGAASGATIVAQLSQAAVITGTQEVVTSRITTTTAADGTYTLTLQANNDLTPTGTYYTVNEFALDGGAYQFTIVVPQTAGPFVVTNILTAPPTLGASPSHVSTLTVDGLATAGSLNVTAGETGIDTIAAGALVLGDNNATSIELGAPVPGLTVTGNADVGTALRVGGGLPWWDLTHPTFGARGDFRSLADAAITSGQAVVTSPSNGLVVSNATYTGLVPYKAGQVIGITGAGPGGATLVGTVLASPAPTSGALTINVNASTTVSGAYAAGGTDDTAAVQAWINKCSTNSNNLFAPGADGFYGPGAYILTASITIPQSSTNKVMGGAFRAATFYMLTDNIPIFKTADDGMHDWVWDQIAFSYLANQGAANTNAIGFMLHSATHGAGWYHWTIGRMYFGKCYKGIAFDPAGTGIYSCWDWEAHFLYFAAMQYSAISWVGPVGSGMPTNTFRHIAILNTASGVTPTGPAIETAFCELQIDSLDIEDWANHLLDFGRTPTEYIGVEIRQLHVERHKFTAGANDWMIRVGAQGVLKVSFFDMESSSPSPAVLGAGNVVSLFQLQANARLNLEHLVSDMSAPSTGSFQLVKAVDNTPKAWTKDIRDIYNSFGGLPCPDSDATTVAVIQGPEGFGLFRNGVWVLNNDIAAPPNAKAGLSSDGFITHLTATGTLTFRNNGDQASLDTSGNWKVNGGPGFYGHGAPVQPAAPVTLADVIAIIRGCGLSL